MSKLKIGFIVNRNLYFKFFGPLIRELELKGVDIHIFLFREPGKLDFNDKKIFYKPFLSSVPFRGPTTKSSYFSSLKELGMRLQSEVFDYVVSLHSPTYFGFSTFISKWVTLQHGIDSFSESEINSDIFFVYSKHWIPEKFKISEHTRVIEVGLYYAEKIFDRDEVCRIYGLDPRKRYATYIPLPESSINDYWYVPNFIWRAWTTFFLLFQERYVLKKLSTICSEAGFELLTKSRFKRSLPNYFYKHSKVFYDESFYPATLNHLLFLSDHVISNYYLSLVLTEAVEHKKTFWLINYPFFRKDLNLVLQKWASTINIYHPYKDRVNEISYRDLAEFSDKLNYNIAPDPDYKKSFFPIPSEVGLTRIVRELTNHEAHSASI